MTNLIPFVSSEHQRACNYMMLEVMYQVGFLLIVLSVGLASAQGETEQNHLAGVSVNSSKFDGHRASCVSVRCRRENHACRRRCRRKAAPLLAKCATLSSYTAPLLGNLLAFNSFPLLGSFVTSVLYSGAPICEGTDVCNYCGRGLAQGDVVDAAEESARSRFFCSISDPRKIFSFDPTGWSGM